MVLGLRAIIPSPASGRRRSWAPWVGLSLVREMGRWLAAFKIIARGGWPLAAELGSMRISEQIDALRTMDINPFKFLVSPRLAAASSLPAADRHFDVVGIVGGYLTGSVLLGLASGVYFGSVDNGVEMADVTGGFIKSLVFAAVVVTVCCYRGYYAHRSPEGFGSKAVSYATTSSLLLACVLVISSEYVMTSILMRADHGEPLDPV